MNKKTIKDIDVKGKKCFVRVDFNVPLDKSFNITDENRIQGALPTINYLLENGAKVILCSHLGRPAGTGFEEAYSLKPVAKRLAELLPKTKVSLACDVIGECAKKLVSEMKDGEIVLLENVRFHKQETKNDEAFSKELASLCDIFVNDAFGAAHRAHSSTAGISNFTKTAVSGFLMGKELEFIGGALESPKRPFVAILGGAKVSDKIGVITNLLDKVDTLIIGGAMAYTFIKAQGGEVGNSLCENDKIDLAKEIIQKAKDKKVNLLLPCDTVIAQEFKNDTQFKTVDSLKIPVGWQGLDIGQNTIKKFEDVLKTAKTVIWNGPMGVFEMPNFAKGTEAIAVMLSKIDAITIIGGGDSAAAVIQMGYADKMSHISTGGGASLEFIEGKVLPGVDCLNNK